MVSYLTTSGGVFPSNESYSRYDLSPGTTGGSIVLSWAEDGTTNPYTATDYMEVTSSLSESVSPDLLNPVPGDDPFYTIKLPPASSASNGQSLLIVNIGLTTDPATFFPVTIQDAAGGVLCSIPVGSENAILLTLTDNSTLAPDGETVIGSWSSIILGVTSTGDLNPGNIAGNGLIGLPGVPIKLNVNMSPKQVGPTYAISGSDDGKLLVYFGGAANFVLPPLDGLPASIPAGFFFSMTNQAKSGSGSGGIVLLTPQNGYINGLSQYVLFPGNSATFICGGASVSGGVTTTYWYTLGATFVKGSFASYELNVTGKSSPYVLNMTESSRDQINLTGEITENFTICLYDPVSSDVSKKFPPLSQVYYLTNHVSGAFNLKFQETPLSSDSYILDEGVTTIFLWNSDTSQLSQAAEASTNPRTLQLFDGSLLAPSLGYFFSPETGLYREEIGNKISFSFTGATSSPLTISKDNVTLTKPLYVSEGTYTAPGYSFSSNTDTGWYVDGTGAGTILHASINATNILNITKTSISSNFPLLLSDGSAANPAYSFSAEDKTGFYRAAANTIGITVNGIPLFLITPNGLYSMNSTMHVSSGVGSPAKAAFSFFDEGTGFYWNSIANTVAITRGGSHFMNILPGGGGSVVDPLQLSDGSYLGPTYSFASEVTMGMYRISLGTLGFNAATIKFTNGTTTSFTLTASSFKAGSTTQQIISGQGTASLPGFAFFNKENTGFYWNGSDICVAVDGLHKMTLSGTDIPDPLRLGSGSLSAPTYSFAGNTSTGWYVTGTGDVAILSAAINGNNAFNIAKNSITSPSSLYLPSGTSTKPAYSFSDFSEMGMYRNGNMINLKGGPIADDRGGGILVCGRTEGSLDFVEIMEIGANRIIPYYPISALYGSSLLPAYSFDGDPDKGMYLSFTELGISCGTVEKFVINMGEEATPLVTLSPVTFTTTLNLQTVSGTDETPAYSFTDYPDVGVYCGETGYLNLTAYDAINLLLKTSSEESNESTTCLSVDSSGLTVNQQIFAPLGQAGSPSYSFIDNTDTGIYGTNATESVLLKTLCLSVNSTDVLVAAAGTGIDEGKGYVLFSRPLLAYLAYAATPPYATKTAYSFEVDPDAGLKLRKISDARYQTELIGSNEGILLSAPGYTSISLESAIGTKFEVTSSYVSFNSSLLSETTGSAASPVYSFLDYNDTGFFLQDYEDPEAHNIGVSIAGGQIAEFASQGIYLPLSGTASEPSISLNAKNTGFYWNGSDICVAVDGSYKMTLNGAGTADPLQLSNGSEASPTYSFSSFTDIGMYAFGSGTLRLIGRDAVLLYVRYLDSGSPAVTVVLSLTPSQTISYKPFITSLPYDATSPYATETSYSFLNDTTAGLKLKKIDGTPTYQTELIGSSGGLLLSTSSSVAFNGPLRSTIGGSASSPVYSFSGNSNTGIYGSSSPTSKTLNMSVNGQEIIALYTEMSGGSGTNNDFVMITRQILAYPRSAILPANSIAYSFSGHSLNGMSLYDFTKILAIEAFETDYGINIAANKDVNIVSDVGDIVIQATNSSKQVIIGSAGYEARFTNNGLRGLNGTATVPFYSFINSTGAGLSISGSGEGLDISSPSSKTTKFYIGTNLSASLTATALTLGNSTTTSSIVFPTTASQATTLKGSNNAFSSSFILPQAKAPAPSNSATTASTVGWYSQPLAIDNTGLVRVQYQMSRNLLQGADFDMNPCRRTGQSTEVTYANATTPIFPVDRFFVNASGVTTSGNYSIGRVSDVPSFISPASNTSFLGTSYGNYSLKVTLPATTYTYGIDSYLVCGQAIEPLNYLLATYQPLVFSFWAKVSQTGTFSILLALGGPSGAVPLGNSTARYLASFAITSANTWQFFSISIPQSTLNIPDQTNTGYGAMICWVWGGTYNGGTAADWYSATNKIGIPGQTNLSAGGSFQIFRPQLEVGTTPTPFEIKDVSGVVTECNRYCATSYPLGVLPSTQPTLNGAVYGILPPGTYTANDYPLNSVQFPVSMFSSAAGFNITYYKARSGTITSQWTRITSNTTASERAMSTFQISNSSFVPQMTWTSSDTTSLHSYYYGHYMASSTYY